MQSNPISWNEEDWVCSTLNMDRLPVMDIQVSIGVCVCVCARASLCVCVCINEGFLCPLCAALITTSSNSQDNVGAAPIPTPRVQRWNAGIP